MTAATALDAGSFPESLPRLLGTPLHVSWVVTSRCNLACDYCLEDALPAAGGDDVPGAARELIVSEIVAAHVLKVNVSGGEPLLVDALPALIARLRDAGVFVRMTTNGVLLDGPLADGLAEARLSVAEISLHPGRGREVLRAVSLLAARGVRTIVRVVVSSANARTLEDIVAPFRAAGVERVMLQEAVPLGRAAGAGRCSVLMRCARCASAWRASAARGATTVCASRVRPSPRATPGDRSSARSGPESGSRARSAPTGTSSPARRRRCSACGT